jgi:exosortase F-associated protein
MISKKRHIVLGIACTMGLIIVFIWQRFDFSAFLGLKLEFIQKFIVNRTIRFLLNDCMAIGLIYALFQERKYVVFALWVQLIGVVFILIPYFILKVYFPAYNGPLISHLHRLIMNPTLLLLLIPAFYHQRRSSVGKV